MEKLIMIWSYVIIFTYVWSSKPVGVVSDFLIKKLKIRSVLRTLIECDFCIIFWVSLISLDPFIIASNLIINSIMWRWIIK